MDLPLKNSFKINNKILGSISVFDLQKRSAEIIIPYNQRLKDLDKVNEIVEYQRQYYNINNFYNYLGVINLHFCLENKKYYLVDGQHRYLSLKKMVENHIDFDIAIEVIIIKEKNDLLENYNIINKNTPLPELSENINKLTHQLIFLHFENKFNKSWSLSKQPKRPYINKNHFQEAISYLLEKLSNDDPNYLIKLINDHNLRISKWNPCEIGNMEKLKNPLKTLELCKNLGCFLGLYSHKEEYHYKWVIDIIRIETGEEIKIVKRRRRKNIPKTIKQGVWNKYVGLEKGSIKCMVCNNETITQGYFAAGHVISEFNNGKITIDNLRPICNLCNQSMYTKNMYDFVRDHFPENVSKLGLANF
jgi:hypothetical protein